MDDLHFLERLERLDDTQGQEALALYYDAPLVRALIGYAKLESDSARVAISLDDPREGPFLLVARDGAFVTALGRGMSPGPHPIIPKAALDAIRRDHVHVTEAWAAAVKAARGRQRDVARTCVTGGARVSREVMAGLIATAHAQERFWMEMYAEALRGLSSAAQFLMDGVGRRTLPDEYFLSLGRALHTLANALVVLGASDFKRRPASDPLLHGFLRSQPTASLALFAEALPLLRGVWSVGKFGGALLAEYKAMLRGAASGLSVMDSALGLAAIGTRFARHRGEVRKALTWSMPATPQALDPFRCTFTAAALAHDLDRERAREFLRGLGAATLRELAPQLRSDHPLWVPPEGPIPDALTLPAAVNMSRNFLLEPAGPGILQFAHVGAALGALEPEELYFPQAVTERIGPGVDVDRLRSAMAALRAWSRRAPVHVNRGPGRNERCGCGSGRKSERCCGSPLQLVA